MKKTLAIVLALVMVLALVPFGAMAEEEYIEIRTAQDLANINNEASLKKNYILMNDIDLSAFNAQWNSANGGWWVLGWLADDVPFTGVFDGNYHKITGLTHDETGGVNGGLFAINSGVIQNLTIEGANFRSGAIVGAFAGINYGIIANCHLVDSTIAAAAVADSPFNFTWFEQTFKGSLVGGICGINYGQVTFDTVKNSRITWNNTNAKQYTGPYVGGLVGAAGYEDAFVGQSYVLDSYVGFENAQKEGSLFHVGGAVGCMASAKGMTDVAVARTVVSGLQFVGGLVGTLNYTSAINSASWGNGLRYLNSEYYPVADPCCPQLPPTGSAVINMYFESVSDYGDDGAGIIGIATEKVLSGNVIEYGEWKLDEEYWKYEEGQYPLPKKYNQMYEPYEHTVRFYADGVLLDEQTVIEGRSATAPTNVPEKEGYTFVGWDKEFVEIYRDMDINAVYEKIAPTYTVTFIDGLTDETISTQQVKEGENATAPEIPVHEGYEFAGWSVPFVNIQSDLEVIAMYDEIGGNTTVRGDANVDGIVDSADATTVLRYVAQLENLEGVAMKNADANEDTIVDSADATSILRFVAQLGW